MDMTGRASGAKGGKEKSALLEVSTVVLHVCIGSHFSRPWASILSNRTLFYLVGNSISKIGAISTEEREIALL